MRLINCVSVSYPKRNWCCQAYLLQNRLNGAARRINERTRKALGYCSSAENAVNVLGRPVETATEIGSSPLTSDLLPIVSQDGIGE
jgi:hypothetical protein